MKNKTTKISVALAVFTALCLGSYQGSTSIANNYASSADKIINEFNQIDGMNLSLTSRDRSFFTISDSYTLKHRDLNGELHLKSDTKLFPWDTSGIVLIDEQKTSNLMIDLLPLKDASLKWNANHDLFMLGDEDSEYHFIATMPDFIIERPTELNRFFGVDSIREGYVALTNAKIEGVLINKGLSAEMNIDELKTSIVRDSGEMSGFAVRGLKARDYYGVISTEQNQGVYDGGFEIDELSINADDGKVEAKNISFSTLVSSKDTLSAEQKLNIGDVLVQHKGIILNKQDIGYEWDISGLDISLDNEVIASDRYQADLAEHERVLLSVVESGIELNIDRLNLGLIDGKAKITTLPISKERTQVGASDIVNGASADIELNVDKAVLAFLPINSEQVTSFETAGYITGSEDKLTVKIKYSEDKLTIGKVEI
ncbi:hypothetical protein LMH73_023250 [Vibrio splendidus]|nr:hypothetical protein [Vibrio splendidus]MCC4881536.1 hypothetical protein [Vibrio splendidus]